MLMITLKIAKALNRFEMFATQHMGVHYCLCIFTASPSYNSDNTTAAAAATTKEAFKQLVLNVCVCVFYIHILFILYSYSYTYMHGDIRTMYIKNFQTKTRQKKGR